MMIKPKESKYCQDENCIFCKNEVPCGSKQNVYKFTCNNCTNDNDGGKEQFYIGGSRRVISRRFGEHESSVRRFTKAPSLGLHMIEKHPELKPSHIPKRGKVNFENLFKQFKPQILKNGKDTLENFILEGMAIKSERPPLNGMLTNGYIF